MRLNKLKQYIGKIVKIVILRNNVNLFYTAKIINVNDKHIIFKDNKFKKLYCFRINDIVEINMEDN